MNYITNESGDVKVRHMVNGEEKWIPKHLAEDKFLMRGQDLEIVPAPMKFEDEETSESNDNKVAESAPAKTGKATKK